MKCDSDFHKNHASGSLRRYEGNKMRGGNVKAINHQIHKRIANVSCAILCRLADGTTLMEPTVQPFDKKEVL